MNVHFQRDGYIAKVLTWGMSPKNRLVYLNSLQDGCPLVWSFLFMFVWSLGTLRRDQGTFSPEGMRARINEKVAKVSETEAGKRIGKGIFILFIIFMVMCVGTVGYALFFTGETWNKVKSFVLFMVFVICAVFLTKGASLLTRWIGSTEVWILLTQKVKSIKEKTCPLVRFV